MKTYAGQNKVSREIDKKVKAESSRSEESKQKAANRKKVQYYAKIMKNQITTSEQPVIDIPPIHPL